MNGRARDCSVGRRRFLKQVTTAATGTVLVGSAGCLSLLGLDGGGTAGIGGGPTFQDIHREDADVIVESAAALKSEVNRGGDRIVWVPSDAQIDMTDRNITVRNATIASGRSDEGSGALIVTTDRGRGSPAAFDLQGKLAEIELSISTEVFDDVFEKIALGGGDNQRPCVPLFKIPEWHDRAGDESRWLIGFVALVKFGVCKCIVDS